MRWLGPGGGAVGNGQLAEDVGHAHAGRLGADEQLGGDAGPGVPSDQQRLRRPGPYAVCLVGQQPQMVQAADEDGTGVRKEGHIAHHALGGW